MRSVDLIMRALTHLNIGGLIAVVLWIMLGALLEFAASGGLEDRARWKEKGDALIEKRMRTRRALPPSNPVA